MTGLNRRRFITLFASAASMAIAAPQVLAATPKIHRWQGTALGAEAAIYLDGVSQARADYLISVALSEIERLEKMFSLYRPDSTISQLNFSGSVENPEQEFVELMSKAIMFARHTNGAFDPTVQPLWQRLAQISQQGVMGDEPYVRAEIGRLLPIIGYGAIDCAPVRVSFLRPDMQVTLNGIAQGYITDRVSAILRRNGMENVLVDLGEKYALGPQADGAGWPVRIESAGSSASSKVLLGSGALATSAGSGFPFNEAGQHNHLIDPRTGLSPVLWERVSVFADTATEADALSTAFSMMPENEIRQTMHSISVHKVIVRPHGTTTDKLIEA
ncbi:FAD:protein FMN transferase [Thalassospira alkalitolerans]|uniref:FAD:protein FMN transferase n=1 Tax=Thalassospira alkalitolerans TaxID=1293890 RepID=UPI003AA8D8C0